MAYHTRQGQSESDVGFDIGHNMSIVSTFVRNAFFLKVESIPGCVLSHITMEIYYVQSLYKTLK